MYLRRHDKRVDGEEYGYWSLVESIRTARGPRQRIVATIGKLPRLDQEEWIGWAHRNPQARRGDRRDGRPDCPQICIGLVTSREGLPLAFEVFDGNRSDVITTKDMVLTMEWKYSQADRIWVMDRRMVSEANMAFLSLGMQKSTPVGIENSLPLALLTRRQDDDGIAHDL